MPHEDYECLENEWSWLCSVQVVHRDPCATRVLLFKLKWRTEINSSRESFATFLQVLRESHMAQTALQRALLRKTYHILDKRATSLAWNEIQLCGRSPPALLARDGRAVHVPNAARRTHWLTLHRGSTGTYSIFFLFFSTFHSISSFCHSNI